METAAEGDEEAVAYAAVCVGGHILSAAVSSTDALPKFCMKCGGEALVACRNCDTPIPGGADLAVLSLPNFCADCGYPHPWVRRFEAGLRLSQLVETADLLSEARAKALHACRTLCSEGIPSRGAARAYRRLTRLAPSVVERAAPILDTLLDSDAKTRLGLPIER